MQFPTALFPPLFFLVCGSASFPQTSSLTAPVYPSVLMAAVTLRNWAFQMHLQAHSLIVIDYFGVYFKAPNIPLMTL